MWSLVFDPGLLKDTAKKCIKMFTNRNQITVNMLITLKCKETRLLSSHYRLNPFLSLFVSFISGDAAIEKSTQMKTTIFFQKWLEFVTAYIDNISKMFINTCSLKYDVSM